jgi:hypothetical protein
MKIKIITSVCIAMLVCAFTKGLAQVSTKDTSKIPRCYWMALGLGASSLGSLSGTINANAEISNRWLLTANVGIEQNTFLNLSSSPNVQVTTFNILAGKIYKKKISFIALSAGLALVNVYTYNNAGLFGEAPVHKLNQYTVGVPLLIQGHVIRAQAVGIGLSGYVNLNTIQTTAGLNICLVFGRIATHKRDIKSL